MLRKSIRLKLLVITALAACVFAAGLRHLRASVKRAATDRIVVVISLDGFPAYALEDSRLPVPTLRRLAREGAAAEALIPINPTVTWPNHTTLVTGVDASVHQVLYNGLLVRPERSGAFHIDAQASKNRLVHAPTVYDLAYRSGLTTAQVDWVATQDARTLTWELPEIPDADGAIEKELIAKGIVTADQVRTFEDGSQAWQDQIWTDGAVQILTRHKPNLLLFHLLQLDNTNHEYGPMSAASFTAMAFVDDRVNQVIRALQQADLLPKTTILIVSDHGFAKITRSIHPNVLLARTALYRQQSVSPHDNPPARNQVWIMAEGGTADVYFDKGSPHEELEARIRLLFGKVEGVDAVLAGNEITARGWPSTSESDQAPDMILTAKEGYSFADGVDGDLVTPSKDSGTHGYLNSDPRMRAIFIAWGKGVARGAKLGTVSNVDVAPTIARLLGLKMENVQGYPIQAISP